MSSGLLWGVSAAVLVVLGAVATEMTVLLALIVGVVTASLRRRQFLALERCSAANLEIARRRIEAEVANRAKSEFLANMSHEIRTPLTSILGYADLLALEGDIARAPKRRLELLETIRLSGQHLLTVLNDVLDLSKIEAGRMDVESAPVDVPELLDEVVMLMHWRAAEKNLELVTEVTTPVPRSVLTDSTRVRQILMNLIGNSLKFTESGRVVVRLGVEEGPTGPTLCIDVEDTGVGLSPTQAEALFQAFTQGDESGTRSYGGTGLGLTISRRLARLLQGDVTLERSAPGEGAHFRLRWPLVQDPSCTDVAHPGKLGMRRVDEDGTQLPRLEGRILYVEDNPINRKLVATMLERAGAKVLVANDGAHALEVLQSQEVRGTAVDLVLTDVQMPVMDGYQLVAHLRAQGSRLPVLALTANAMVEDRLRILAAGCDDYAAKPIDRAALITMCARWLRRGATRVAV